jgi:hypothetical protein
MTIFTVKLHILIDVEKPSLYLLLQSYNLLFQLEGGQSLSLIYEHGLHVI